MNTKTPDFINLSVDRLACNCENTVCTHDTTDIVRSRSLITFDDSLDCDPLYVPLREYSRGPDMQSKSSAPRYPVEEAADRLRNGARGFFLYADDPAFGTDGLIITDEDDPEQWPHVRDTLTVVSGSGTGRHRYWINDGWNRGSSAKDDLEGIGGVHVNAGVVAPGSVHHETDGIYHVAETHPVAPLAPSDLPEALRPRSNMESGDHTYNPPENADETAVETVSKAIRWFRTDPETTRTARDYLADLIHGCNYVDHGFESDGSGCRHRANLALASKLHGVLLMAGERDDDRNHWLISEYLAHIANEIPKTDDGQKRKLRIGKGYIRTVVSEAIRTFDPIAFKQWRRKRNGNQMWRNDYSPATKETVSKSVDMAMVKNNGEYPTKSEIVEECQRIDPSRSEATHRQAISNLVNRHEPNESYRLKRADLGDNRHIYYKPYDPDPDDAVAVYPACEQ